MLKIGVGFLFIAAWVQSAWADENLATLSLEQLSSIQVTSAAKTEQKISDAPATMYVFTRQDILNRGYRNLAQLLADVPEIEINVRGSIEQYNLISVRGVVGSDKNLIILQDGIRISAITGSPTPIQYNFPLQQAKRVEVIIGPASALYGADAMMGVVNIITLDPSDLEGGAVTGSWGRFSTTDNSLVLGKTFGDVGVMLSGSQYYTAEAKFPDFYPELFGGYTTYQNTGVLPGITGAPITVPVEPYSTPTKAFTFGGKAQVSNFEFGYWRSFSSLSSAGGGRPERTLYINADKIVATVETLYGRYRYVTPDRNWSFKTEISKGSQTMEPDSLYLDYYSDFNPAYKYESDKATKFEEEAVYTISATSNLIAGFDYEDFSALPKTSDLPSPYDPKLGTGSQGMTYPGTSILIPFYSIFYQNYGPYGQIRFRVADFADFTVGARYDYNTRFGGSTNPRIGAVFTPSDSFKAKLLYAEAFRAPSPYIEYQTFGSFTLTGNTPTGGFFTVPNGSLGPEKVRSIETNLSYQFSKDLAISGDVFLDHLYKVIEDTPLPSGYVFMGVPISGTYPTNRGALVSYGGTIKLEAVARPGSYYLKPFIAYSMIAGNQDGDYLPNAARVMVKSGTDISHGKLTLYPHLEFRTRSYVPNVPDAYAPTYYVLNLAARYENVFGAEKFKTALFADFWNLLDRRYANSNQLNITEFGATPQDPFRFLLGATVSF